MTMDSLYRTAQITLLLLICVEIGLGTNIIVMFNYRISNSEIQLLCYTNPLFSRVKILDPEKKMLGECDAPIREKNHTSCTSDKSMKQTLDDNITALTVPFSQNKVGMWTCLYETNLGNATVNVPSCLQKDGCETDGSVTYAWTVTTIVLLIANGFGCLYLLFKNRDAIRSKFSSRNGDYSGLPGSDGMLASLPTGTKCCLCKMPGCALCVDCESFYCEACCKSHLEKDREHTVATLEHRFNCQRRAACSHCHIEDPIEVCIECKKIFCQNCTCKHKEGSEKIKLVWQPPEHMPTNMTEQNVSFTLTKNITFGDTNDHIVVSGFICTENDIFIISDKRNNCLWLKSSSEPNTQKHILNDDPRGLARMDDMKFAVSLMIEKRIAVFNIDNVESIKKVNTIDLSSFGKPFELAYDNNHFCVEIDEGDSGFIGIVDGTGQMLHKIGNLEGIAYFSGSQIRLGLDFSNGRIFVSAIGMKDVKCLSLKGEENWTADCPSPRGLFYNRINSTILLASKRFNSIYKINAKNGKYTLLFSTSDATEPRYVFFNNKKKLLYLQVGNCDVQVYRKTRTNTAICI